MLFSKISPFESQNIVFLIKIMKSKNRFNPSRLHVASGRDEDSGDGGRVAMEDEDDFSLSLSL